MSRARDLADAGSKANFLDNVSADINTTYAPINNPAFTGTFSSEAIIGGLKSIQVFTSTGTSTWTKPSGIRTVKVFVTGSGGGGGGGNSNNDMGSGGGAGGTAIKIIDVSSVSSVAVTVGVGGNAGSMAGNGGGGNVSGFGTYCTASGGGGGTQGNAGAIPGGAGGVGTGGDINIRGGYGNNGQDNIYDSGYESSFGIGGTSFWGGGARGATHNNMPSTSKTSASFGAGGGGGNSDDVGTSTGVGGVGMDGVVVVEEYI